MALVKTALRAASALFEAGWETRRRTYAAGWLRTRRVDARVVSVGNLTVGGTGKTTLTLHLARAALEAGRRVAVVCRNYRPGPAGWSDEALLFRRTLGESRVFAGRSKLQLAATAARSGHDLVLVDDGFSHWPLERNLDLVLLDSMDPWGGGALIPAGRMREPRRALQRADWLVLTRLPPGRFDPRQAAEVSRYAPGARLAAGRHRVVGLEGLDGRPTEGGGRVRVVTAVGNPEAVARSAREAGLEVTGQAGYRDHHWFGRGEAQRELSIAAREGARVLVTAKDAVRWPLPPGPDMMVIRVEWEWIYEGEALMAAALGGDAP